MLSAGKRILLGITGGIAACKSPDLVRRLMETGAQVQVVMTQGAQRFVTPLTFQTLSGRSVRTDLWDMQAEHAMGHIELARWAQLVLVAPATASFLARLAHGHADDLLTTLCLATEAPIVAAPAMNWLMWENAATQENLRLLRQRGVRLLGPVSGALAEGETGMGRMLEPAEIVAALKDEGDAVLKGVKVMVTAGPTREPLDPVRYVSNRSSGKMGFAVARAAAEAGAEVTLVSGPVALATPRDVRRVDVETAAQMRAAVMDELESMQIFIAAAAVSDYAPVRVARDKIKKRSDSLELKLARTPDILAQVAASKPRPFTVGFAAETERLAENARAKLTAKHLDMIAANWVGPGRGFESQENALSVYWKGGMAELGTAQKLVLARQLVRLIAERYANHR
ncbi:MAG: bifunctional phosphopantothenoylcysteine decarboxylase/phosphopantothenate--cysteine ligase CoaBC [Gammaproteobacteria bacterium]|nr:bifunctional phosphopantothenoylcysteine decarboxylase/phosphopantothenate--cysteine ligase CoaBC [Gammaproteobacteria bacterium]MDE2345232.1 bifunctional phosphopantothenoylcysteine decarboxylase/phosphopantothenate--cysteine ligase CoaBC [Gammaproteobacteria bacterium]